MINITLESRTPLDAILHQRIINLFTTRIGTVPFMRDFGINMDAVDMPVDIAANMFAAEMSMKLRKYEQTVAIESVTPDYSNAESGKISLRVVITSA